jgi:ubiquinone/menaquinone biosynthesis C-methylase UbiE
MTQERDLPLGDSLPVIDYEGSGYRTDFWEGQGREYEDAAERLALMRIMPPSGLRIAEIGAGFGRLADQYLGYEQIVLFDYSRTLLADAARHWGHDPRFVFVAGNLYELPLADNVLDTLVMVRVMHHLADVPAALRQVRRVLHGHSVAVVEYANKRNLKAMLRWAARQQAWSPLDPEPVEFVELNFDFHPGWMSDQLRASEFKIVEQYGVSHFRLPLVKDRVAPDVLARLDASLFGIGGRYPVAPSVFVQLQAPYAGARRRVSTAPEAVEGLFRCPVSGTASLERIEEDRLRSVDSGLIYTRREGVWDFKEPIK